MTRAPNAARSKYSPLTAYLSASTQPEVTLSLTEIENVIGAALPASARRHKAWWSNGGHSHASAWLDAGFSVIAVNLKSMHVRLARNGTAARLSRPQRARVPKKALESARSSRHFSGSLDVAGVRFERVCDLQPDQESSGEIWTDQPHERYAKADEAVLLPFGDGPFCRFRIPATYAASGVYVVTVNGSVRYIGLCENLRRRWNMGYGQISPRNCFRGGQATNVRINRFILEAVQKEQRVELWFHETGDYAPLEARLIGELAPAWNKQGTRITLNSFDSPSNHSKNS